MNKKIVIIGAVAGGANVATRARRLNEAAEITLIERGPFVSYANCGLPYHLGGEIAERQKLFVHTPESLAKRFGLKVLVNTEALEINRQEKSVLVKNISGQSEKIFYDELVLSTGAAPIKPPLPGSTAKGVFTLRDIPDMDAILAGIKNSKTQKAIVVGGGYVGIEVAEQLTRLNLHVTVVEGENQILLPLDPEMAGIIEDEISQHLQLQLGSRLKEITTDSNETATGIILENGTRLPADLIILGLGVRPENKLAKDCDLKIGNRGGIVVNEFLQTSDPNIWAVGDVIEVKNFVTGQPTLLALAGPANRQGRMVADNIFLPNKKSYQGTLGTAVVRTFTKIAACTGANEKTLQASNLPYEKLYLFPNSHASYFPGAKELAIKILFSPQERKLLGAQVIGEDGADKRIDVFATAIKGGLTIDDIAELELCYAPPVGSAKDPVNMAGMMMQNVADGLVEVIAPLAAEGFILDVRSSSEVAETTLMPGAINIPMPEITARLAEIPKDQKIYVYCLSGQRSYNVVRKLTQLGFKAVNITGAYKAYLILKKKLP